MAIIGAGAGGVAAAHLLADTYDVDLFEARSKIGGHCDSHVIEYRGRRVTVDIGAQFFHPDTHPIYVTLPQELGLYDPAHPATDDTLEAPASLCIFPTGGGAPIIKPQTTDMASRDFDVGGSADPLSQGHDEPLGPAHVGHAPDVLVLTDAAD